MLNKDQMLENHKRRIKRAGPKLWDNLQEFTYARQLVSGEKALEICNTYGLSMIDLMLFLDACDCKYDFEEWYRLKFDQEKRLKNSIQCNAKDP